MNAANSSDQPRAELDELLAWIVLADQPANPPSFISTKMLVNERKAHRFALECALDYAHHMAPEDLARIRATYDSITFEGHSTMIHGTKADGSSIGS